MLEVVAKVASGTECFHVIRVRTFDWLTRASVLPEMGDGQHYYRSVPALAIVPETESELAV